MKTNLIDNFFYSWALVIPITSIVLLPIKGSTPAYCFAFFSLLLIFLIKGNGKKIFIRDLIIFLMFFISLNLLAQLFLSLSPPMSFSDLKMVHTQDESYFLRKSMFTQSIYLLAAVITFLYVKSFYKPCWDKYIYYGITFLALYGLYELVYFLIFNESGDFLTNRIFGEDEGEAIVNGSAFQILKLGPVVIQRLKSLTGEPSMYAFTVLPFWIYAIHDKRLFIHILLLVTLVLSMSATAMVGICVYILGRFLYFGLRDKYSWVLIGAGLMTIAVFFDLSMAFFESMILAKVNLEHISGITRYSLFSSSIDFFQNMYLPNQLFGIGFGYVRSANMLSTLLVNNGVIGFLIFTMLFFYPIVKLPNNNRGIGLKLSLTVIYVTMMVSVPEFAYLSSWLFLGIAYHQLRRNKCDENIH